MKIGFLPLYISLYNKFSTALRDDLEVFYNELVVEFEKRGIEVVKSKVCTESEDFEKAIKTYEDSNCDAIVTFHLAYSPSLNSEKALKNTKLPIIICDTTMEYDFSDKQSPVKLDYCHGIHGVMDMCNLLKKNKKPYAVVAGHFKESDVLDRVIGYVKAAKAANSLKGSKVGSIGGYFEGMGDFQISDEQAREVFGVNVVYPEKDELKEIIKTVTDEEIAALKAKNEKEFNFLETVDEEVYRNSMIADITLRKWIEKRGLQAFSVNFLEVLDLPTMPFTGICRAMQDKIGYAGEGDVLTAMFTGALMQGYEDTSFVEIFCPDWKNNTIFINHMGEINYRVSEKKPNAYRKDFSIGNCADPVIAPAGYKPGNAVFINIFEDDKGFNAFISPVKVLNESTDNFKTLVRGWLDFSKPIPEVLEKISNLGATHHSILVYDAKPEEIAFFAKCVGVSPIVY